MNLAIHGVGTHRPGVIQDKVQGWPSSESTHDTWYEFNWNQFVDQVDGSTLNYAQIEGVIGAMAQAGRMLFDPEAERSRVRRASLATLRAVVGEVDALLGLALLLLTLLPPLALLTQLGVMIFSASWAPLHVVLAVLTWTAAVVGVGILVVAALSSALSLAFWSAYPLTMACCWIALLIMRPIVYVCLVPFTPLIWELLTVGRRTGLAIAVFVMMWVVGFALSPIFGPAPGQEFQIVWVVAGLIAGACLTWIAGQVTYLLMGPTLKVLLDIFRYVGQPGYRDTLQAAFDSVLARTPDTHFTISAHSLGSVIAADSLLNSTLWHTKHSVTLITMGSPLHRCFFRFFPSLLFPPSARQLAGGIRSRVGAFRWLNVYRPFDQIGTSLELNAQDAGEDIRTDQWHRFFTAHTDYFGDARVREIVASALPRLTDTTANTTRTGGGWWRMPRIAPASAGTTLMLRLTPKLTWLLPLLAVWMSLQVPSAKAQWDREIAALRDKVAAEGIPLSARVEHWTTVEGGEDSVDVEHFRLLFEDNALGLREHAIQAGLLFDRANGFFDSIELRRAIREDCAYQRTPAPLERRALVPCRMRTPVRVRWLGTSPPEFDLPDYPPTPDDSTLLLGFWMVWSAGIAAGWGYGFIVLSRHLFAVFSGAGDAANS